MVHHVSEKLVVSFRQLYAGEFFVNKISIPFPFNVGISLVDQEFYVS